MLAAARRSILLVVLAVMLPGALRGERSSLDTQLPVTAVEERACAHMLTRAPKNQSTDIWFNPFQLQGIHPDAGQKIYGYLYPRTPVFLFYYEWTREFRDNPISFPKPIDCFSAASLDDAGKITWSNVPDGDYLVVIISQAPKVRSGSMVGSGSGIAIDGAPVSVTTYTPYTENYTEQHILHIAIHTQGGKMQMAPEWGVVQ